MVETGIYLNETSADEKNTPRHFEVIIFTAIDDLEKRILHSELHAVGFKKCDPGKGDYVHDLYRWIVPAGHRNSGMIVATKCLNAAGNALSGISMLSLLQFCKPSLACFCGIAGSLSPSKAPLGSVVIGERVYWKGFDKISGDDIAWEMRSKLIDSFNLNESILNSFRRRVNEWENEGVDLNRNKSVSGIDALARRWYDEAVSNGDASDEIHGFDYMSAIRNQPKVSFTNVLSWDYVLNRKDIRDRIASEIEKLTCVEMESGGLFLAARKSKKNRLDGRILTVRGISDLCFRKSDDFWREISCRNAAAVLIDYLCSGYSKR